MAIDFAALAETSDRLITENGRPVTLKRGTAGEAGDYDPVEGTSAPAVPVVPAEFAVRAVVCAISTGYAMKRGTQNIQPRDRLLLMGPAVQVLMEDVISFDGEDWQVVHVGEHAPNGLPIGYEVQVRP